MLSRLLKSYNYNRVAVESSVPLVSGGCGVGGLYYMVKDHGGPISITESILGGAFYCTVGAVSGVVLAMAHPIIAAGCVFGLPAYAIQRARAPNASS